MANYLFSLESVELMLSECYEKNGRCESGGVLVGPVGYERIVTDALPSTSFAERRANQYYQSEEDVEILEQELGKYEVEGLDFSGFFHRHPPTGPNALTDVDVKSAVEALESQKYYLPGRLLMVIVTEYRKEPLDLPIFCYVVSLSVTGKVMVERAGFEIMQRQYIRKVGKFIWQKTKANKGGHDEKDNRFRQCDRGAKGCGQSGSLWGSDKRHNDNNIISGKRWFNKGWYRRSP